MNKKKHTEEAKQKISAKNKGQKRTEEQKMNIALSKYGKPRSPEAIQKVKEGKKKAEMARQALLPPPKPKFNIYIG